MAKAVAKKTAARQLAVKRPSREKLLAYLQWSFSKWETFRDCPWRYALIYILKIPERKGPALVKGSMFHNLADQFVKGNLEDFPLELRLYKKQLTMLRDVGASTEESWTLGLGWEGLPASAWYDNTLAWARLKVDVNYPEDGGILNVIDHKTGSVKPIETKMPQVELYAIGGFAMYDGIQTVRAAFWYLEHPDEIHEVEFDASEIPGLKKKWEDRLMPMAEAHFDASINEPDPASETKIRIAHYIQSFPPTPGDQCRYCDFSRTKNGGCPVA